MAKYRRIFSSSQVADIESSYRGGESALSISRRMGCSQPTIRKQLERLNVPHHPSPTFSRRAFGPDEDRLLAKRYLDGESSLTLCREFGCDKSTVIDALHRAGVTLRNKGKARLAEIDRRKDEIVARYNAGEAVWSIKESFGCSSTHPINRILRDAGITVERRPCVREQHHAWKGGTYIDPAGYRRVKLMQADPLFVMCGPNAYVPEHRIVVARSLGRPLKKSESVHHIDGNRLNNDLSNLQLRHGNHGKGARFVCLDCGSHNIEAVQLHRQ